MLTVKPLLWSDELKKVQMAASLRTFRNLVEALDRHLARVYGRRLWTLGSFAKLSK